MKLMTHIKSIRTGTVVVALVTILIALLVLFPFIFLAEWWNTSFEHAKSYSIYKAMIFAPLLAIVVSASAFTANENSNTGLINPDQWLSATLLNLSISLLATVVFFIVVPEYQEEVIEKVERTPEQQQWGDCYSAGREAVWLDRALPSECRGHPGAQQGIREELMKSRL